MGVMTETLHLVPARTRPDLLAWPVDIALREWSPPTPVDEVEVAEIDPSSADTEEFCGRYGIGLDDSANCVVVAAKRAGQTTMAACVVLANTRVDVNGFVRRHLDARKASFAPMDDTVAATAMEYGGITPIGIPATWRLLVDPRAADRPRVIIGSGVRRSKLLLPGHTLAELPGAEVLDGLALPVG